MNTITRVFHVSFLVAQVSVIYMVQSGRTESGPFAVFIPFFLWAIMQALSSLTHIASSMCDINENYSMYLIHKMFDDNEEN